MEIRLLHQPDLVPPYGKTFNFDCSGAINMNVTLGSKPFNLVPFAVDAFKNPNVDKIIWWSKHGAVSKAVACAEMFKTSWSDYIKTNKLDEKENLFQFTKIYLQPCNCTVPGASLKCTIEERSIALVLSKSPFPVEVYENENVKQLESFVNFVKEGKFEDISNFRRIPDDDTCVTITSNNSSLNFGKQIYPSRRRLRHTKKRKRDMHFENNKHDIVTTTSGLSTDTNIITSTGIISSDNNNSSDSQNLELFEGPSFVQYQSGRLAPAIQNVANIISRKNSRKKKSRKAQLNQRKQNN